MGSTEFLAATVAVLAAATVYFHLKKFSYWSSRKVKGPMPWPIWGTNIYYLFENKLKVDARWHKQYGKVYGLYEGYSPLLRVHDRELLNFILVKEFQSFTDRHYEFIHDKVQRNWLLWVPGKQWSARRALVSPQFSSAKMRLMSRHMSTCINRFLKEIERRLVEIDATRANLEAAGGKSEQKSAKMNAGVKVNKGDIMALTLDVIGTNFYSLKLDTYRDKGNEFLARAYDLSRFEIGRFFVWSLTPRQIARALSFDLFPNSKFEYFDLLTKKVIGERRGSSKKPAQKKLDLLQALLDAKLQDSAGELADFSDKEVALYRGQKGDVHHAEMQKLNTKPLDSLEDLEIRGQMSFLLVAGFETTASAIDFSLFELSHQPGIQQLLYEELTNKFGEKTAVLASTDEDFPAELYQDLMSLTFLNAFISEVLRLYSPIIENNRRVVEPVVLPTEPELRLPAGLPIAFNTFIMHHDPEYWDEPDKFDLTRFLPENRDRIQPGAYLPFGLGNRHCLGMRFVLLEMKLALAKIILNYRISPVSSTYPPKFQQNPVFLLIEQNDFKLEPRAR